MLRGTVYFIKQGEPTTIHRYVFEKDLLTPEEFKASVQASLVRSVEPDAGYDLEFGPIGRPWT